MGRDVDRRTAASSWRICSSLSKAQGSAPSPPAAATAIAIGAPTTPAMGARRIGSSIPSRSGMRRSGQAPATRDNSPSPMPGMLSSVDVQDLTGYEARGLQVEHSPDNLLDIAHAPHGMKLGEEIM